MAKNIQSYDIIKSPIVTEKSTVASSYNKIYFTVSSDATKPQIKSAVEDIFDVAVKNVNTLTSKGKVKRFRGKIGKRSDVKKAIVTLAEGSSIDVTSNIK